LDDAMIVGGLDLPVAIELMGVFDKGILSVGIPLGPVLRGRSIALPCGLGAIVVAESQCAPHDALAMVLLIGVTQGQHAVFTDLPVDHAVEEGALLAVAAQPGVALFASGDDTCGPAPVLVQRRRIVGLDALGVPGT